MPEERIQCKSDRIIIIIIKKTTHTHTDGLRACQKPDVDCILMANFSEEVLCFAFCSVPRGELKNAFKRGKWQAKDKFL